MGLVTGKWSFYINGAFLSGMIVLCLYLFKDTVGMNDGLIKVSEYVEKTVQETAKNENLDQLEAPPLEWQTGFLGGIFIGALAASLMSGNWKIRLFQDNESGIVSKGMKTVFLGFAGGFLVMLGLQLSGDSFLGQWSGALQLSGGSWVFLVSCFTLACGISILLENRGGGE